MIKTIRKNLRDYIRRGIFLYFSGMLIYFFLLYNGDLRTKSLYLFTTIIGIFIASIMLGTYEEFIDWIKKTHMDEREN